MVVHWHCLFLHCAYVNPLADWRWHVACHRLLSGAGLPHVFSCPQPPFFRYRPGDSDVCVPIEKLAIAWRSSASDWQAYANNPGTHTAEETNGGSMLADLILNILGPISAKRYPVLRKALWLIVAVFLILLIYGVSTP